MNEKGVSLLESLLVVVILGIMAVLLANIPNALGLITKSRHLSLAREIASKQIEDKRATNYANLADDASPISDSRISLLPQGNGSLLVESCNSETNPQVCPNGEQLKIITVTITWKENNKNQSVSLKTLIGEGGLNQ